MTDVKTWAVRPTNPQDRRRHFEGTEKDARTFVVNNFPRPHVDDPNSDAVPDVMIVGPDGSKHAYVDGEWVSDSDTAPASETEE